ncbi:hypothetical protein O1611_g668 [Lasiodiplodia mahajangana]|uniref:Uncharacterized protein n=1 Tax=Lasiodiplodia mahajangana TaxID=1108764 RepID=A0ACC2JZN9_9PEZI|nr:hypothetical protein O1611_g668 [Lasiodiplodia mahajangana]
MQSKKPSYSKEKIHGVHENGKKQFLNCPYTNRYNDEADLVAEEPNIDPQRVAFEGIAKRLSLLFCLVAMFESTSQSVTQISVRLQPDIERLFFSFPVHYSGVFRESALRGINYKGAGNMCVKRTALELFALDAAYEHIYRGRAATQSSVLIE